MRAFFAQHRAVGASEAPSSSAGRASEGVQAAAQSASQQPQRAPANVLSHLSAPDRGPGCDSQTEQVAAGSTGDTIAQVNCGSWGELLARNPIAIGQLSMLFWCRLGAACQALRAGIGNGVL